MLLSTLLFLAAAPARQASGEETLPEVGVPFACGQAHLVSQAHDTGSHVHYDTWAWDFRMPTGTPVVAALEGVVRLARGDSTRGGCDPRMAPHANYVVVSHGEGLETQYLHFSSVLVKPGDKVRQGQFLGFSGNTGWSCGPHLHFKVARTAGSGWNNPSIPARIAGHGDPERNTVVSAPACPEEPLLMAQPAPATPPASEQAQPAPMPPSGEASQASGGVPPGAREVTEKARAPKAERSEQAGPPLP